MEMLKNVLIKEVGSETNDLVFIVDNLPKSLFYKKVKKVKQVPSWAVDYPGTQEAKIIDDYVLRDENAPDEPRNRRYTGAMTDELHEGIEMSATGDGGYVFNTMYNESADRLHEVDRYIRENSPPTDRLPRRIPYAAQPGLMSSAPRPLSQLPRVVLPEPVSPPAQAVQVSSTPSFLAPVQAVESVVASAKKARKPMTEEQKAAARERLAKAREIQKQKKQQEVTQ